MTTICSKCKYLWQKLGKNYCNNLENCKYSKNKKKCPHFEKGKSIKEKIKTSNNWRKKGE